MHVLLLVLLMTAPKCIYGAARDVWMCQEKVVVYDGPAGTGKTYGDCLLAHVRAINYPGCRQLFVRDTRTSLSQTVLVTFEDKILGPAHPICSGASRSHRESYRYPNGSEIVVGGLDKPGRIMSAEYDFIYVFEATEGVTEEAVEYLMTRLRNAMASKHQMILECNPSHPHHWIKKSYEDGRSHRIQSTHRDNPSYYDQETGEITPAGVEYIEGTLGKMTGHRRRRLLEGVWAGVEGVVYDTFNPEIHVKKQERTDWDETLIAIDVGYTNPYAVLLVRVDGDERLHVEREFYQRKLSPGKRLGVVQGMMPADEVIVDPEDAALRATFREAGLPVMAANNVLNDGIDRVHERLALAGDGLPRLTVDPSCVHTIAEFESYMWDESRDGTLKDKPKKENDHAMDALRYAVNRIDGRSKMELITASSDEDQGDGWDGW